MAKKKSKKSGAAPVEASAKKSKSKAITFVKKRRRVARRNPDDSVALMLTDLAGQAIPVVVTFAGTHVLTHVVGDRLLGGKSYAHHMKVLTALAAVVGVYFAGRTRPLEKYATGALVGTSLAAIATVLQAYVPQFAWLLGGTPTFRPVVQKPQMIAAPKATGDDDDEEEDRHAVEDLSDLGGIFSGAGAGSGWNLAEI